ncbi:uncharacterized protein BXZ73DRAFT_82389 [Epithele typhae]|uniref:uncharacterized protein n=1 Tax=Epithele typhae TaxID=378194 RepID=UPI0020077DF3|nr:uncharacterized protein BXZ73DRAFT_82389 [Epithele typhae]KAH9912315.1 hypothetical protein BXZ73DRAFT_82389 [Epithele typhae]
MKTSLVSTLLWLILPHSHLSWLSKAAHNVAELPLLPASSDGSGSHGASSTTEVCLATVPIDAAPCGAPSIALPGADPTAVLSIGIAPDPDHSTTQETHQHTSVICLYVSLASAAQEPSEPAQEPDVIVDGQVKEDLLRLLAESCDVFLIRSNVQNNSKELRSGLADEINDCLAKLTETQTLVSYLLADPPSRPDAEGPTDHVDEVMNRVPPFIWYLVDHITPDSPECKIDGVTQVLYSYVLTPEQLCWVQVQATISRLEAVKQRERGKRSKRGVRGGTKAEDPPSLEERVIDPEGVEAGPPAASTPADTISTRPRHKHASGHLSCFVPDVLVSAVDGRGRRIRVLLLVENKRTGNPIPQLLDYAKEFPNELDTVFIGVKICDKGMGLQAIILRRESNEQRRLKLVVIHEDGRTEDPADMVDVEGAYVPVHSRFFIQTLLDVLDRHRSHMQAPN